MLADARKAMLTSIRLVNALLGKRFDMERSVNILTKVIKNFPN